MDHHCLSEVWRSDTCTRKVEERKKENVTDRITTKIIFSISLFLSPLTFPLTPRNKYYILRSQIRTSSDKAKTFITHVSDPHLFAHVAAAGVALNLFGR